MTGFAASRGQGAGASWAWEMRSVNCKGFDLRLRLPDWIEGLEPAVRAALSKAVHRGNVSLTLKLTRDAGAEAVRVNAEALRAVLAALAQVDEAAQGAGVALAAPTLAEVLGLRGVLETGAGDEDTGPLMAAVMEDLPGLVAEFLKMRAEEGRALAGVIGAQVDRIEALTTEAAVLAEARRDQMAASLRDNLARVLENSDGADEARVAQELAMIAIKTDVTEELDRLRAHVTAARGLLRDKGAVGRKIDFLMQEFNREANTLCSKAQSAELTRVGLDLKHVIDQMREQVQNVE